VAGAALGYGAIGLLTGLLVDVFNKERVTVYVHQPVQQAPRMHVALVGVKAGAVLQLRTRF